ncbi:HNH endonuclease [Bacillus sp. K2I17]|uniref:HNH endonuclease n=1 Tax=Bacillus sp. K2I17 TaxID=2014743 RepID=UPI000B51BF73|nr:HNH endonuclease [Bacillus sp. K2I17]OWT47530.1 HNH endonuclease [Bacillus sp. K2I17]
MIHLKKEEIPTILKTKGGHWINQYMTFVQSGTKPPNSLKSKYTHPIIKKALLKETKGKCAYCESSFTATDHGHIEHILPKSIFPNRIFEWDNLTLACGKCNINKSDYYNQKNPLINPYIDNPEEDIMFSGPLILARSTRGLTTIKNLELDRVELCERRMAYINSIQSTIILYETTDDIELKKLLYADLLEYTKTNKEYSFMMKTVIKMIDSPVEVL